MSPKPKDYFSGQAAAYAAFRPAYPPALYDFIFGHVHHFDHAWDCATGNGQVADFLAGHFEKVFATDISHQQLEHVKRRQNIEYGPAAAEHTSFPDAFFDLITIGQALHWFDLELFYREVKRVVRPDGLIAAWGYQLPVIPVEANKLLIDFYKNIIGPYWDEARRHVDAAYQSLPFPFAEIPAPPFHHDLNWTLAQLAGFLSSWSATCKFIEVNKHDPVPEVIKRMEDVLTADASFQISFPVFLRLGYVFTLPS